MACFVSSKHSFLILFLMLYFSRSVDWYYQVHIQLDIDKEHEDPWSSDYCGLSVSVFKLVLRSKVISEETKVHMLRNWVAGNSFLKNQAAVFEMLKCLDLKKFLYFRRETFRETIHEVTAMVRKKILLSDNI